MRRLDTTLTPLLGRLMLAALFIWAGFAKIQHPEVAMGYIQHANLPMAQLAYWVAVGVEFGGGLLLAVGLLARPVGVILAVWCLVTAYLYHYDPTSVEQMINVYKNLAMAGGFLYVAAFGAGLISVDATFVHGRRPEPLAERL